MQPLTERCHQPRPCSTACTCFLPFLIGRQISEDFKTNREDEDDVKIKAIEWFAPEGSQVWVKVVEVKEDERGVRVGCSMKAVNQQSGVDLDPDNRLGQGGDRREPCKGYARKGSTCLACLVW